MHQLQNQSSLQNQSLPLSQQNQPAPCLGPLECEVVPLRLLQLLHQFPFRRQSQPHQSPSSQSQSQLKRQSQNKWKLRNSEIKADRSTIDLGKFLESLSPLTVILDIMTAVRSSLELFLDK